MRLPSSRRSSPPRRWVPTLAGTLLLVAPATAGVDFWTSVGPSGGRITVLAVDPSAPGTVYAGTRSGGLFKSVDDGGRWTEVAGGLPAEGVSTLALDPLDPTSLSVGIVTGPRPGVYHSADGGRSFALVGEPLLVGLLARPAGQPGVLWAVAPLEGPRRCAFACVLMSGDGGEGRTWTLISEDAEGEHLFVMKLARAPLAPERLYAATFERFLRSDDGGESWQRRGLLPPFCSAHGLAVDPTDPETIHLLCQNGTLGIFEVLRSPRGPSTPSPPPASSARTTGGGPGAGCRSCPGACRPTTWRSIPRSRRPSSRPRTLDSSDPPTAVRPGVSC